MANYTVKKGDTLSGIAKQYGLLWQDIAKDNNLRNSTRILPGQSLRLDIGKDEGKMEKLPLATGDPLAKENYTDLSTNGTQFKDNGAPIIGSPELKGYDSTSWLDTDRGQAADKANQDAIAALMGWKPSEFTEQDWLDQVLADIKGYGDFSYDLNGDALYQQYKDKYVQQGKLAMMDTMGQAAAMNGGYGSSYAQSVGQQAYQASLDNLNDIVPELYQMALDRYNMGKQDLYNQYGLLSSERESQMAADEREYGRLMDAYGITSSEFYNGANLFNTDQANKNSIIGRENSETLDIWNANIQNLWEESRWNREGEWHDEDIAYRDQRDAIADARYETEWGYKTEQDTLNRTESNARDFHTSGGQIGYDNQGLSPEQVMEIQTALGVEADGKWGPASKEASGGLTAQQALKALKDGKLGKADLDYGDIEEDLNYFISQGADKSEINAYLREALQSGYITTEEYNKLKELYAPRGQVYGTTTGGGGGGGGRLCETHKTL